MLWLLTLGTVALAKLSDLRKFVDAYERLEPSLETLKDSIGATKEAHEAGSFAGSFLSGSQIEDIKRRRAESKPIPDEYYGECVKWINIFRAKEGLPALRRWTAAESCTTEMTQYDFEGDVRGSHSAFRDDFGCDFFGEELDVVSVGQNTCPEWPNRIQTIQLCNRQMWNEKVRPGVDPEDLSCKSNSLPCGHYYNMRGGKSAFEYNKYDMVACGFYINPDNDKMSVNMNFARSGRIKEFECGGDEETKPDETLVEDCDESYRNRFSDCNGGEENYDFMACEWANCDPFYTSGRSCTDHPLCRRMSVNQPGACNRRVNFGAGWMAVNEMCRPSCGGCPCETPPVPEPASEEPESESEEVIASEEPSREDPESEASEEPEASEESEVSEEPEASEESEVSEEPEASEESEVSEEPEASESESDEADASIRYGRGQRSKKSCPEGLVPITDTDACDIAGLTLGYERKNLRLSAEEDIKPVCVYDFSGRAPGYGMSVQEGGRTARICRSTPGAGGGGLRPVEETLPPQESDDGDNSDFFANLSAFMIEISDDFCALYGDDMDSCDKQSHFCESEDGTCVPDTSKASLDGKAVPSFLDTMPFCTQQSVAAARRALLTCSASGGAYEKVAENKSCKGKNDIDKGMVADATACARACTPTGNPFFRISRRANNKGVRCFCESQSNCRQANNRQFDLYKSVHIALTTGETRERLTRETCNCMFKVASNPNLSSCKWRRIFEGGESNPRFKPNQIESAQTITRELMIAYDCFETERTIKCDVIRNPQLCNSTGGCRMSDNGCTLRGYTTCTMVDSRAGCTKDKGCQWFPDGCAEADCPSFEQSRQCRQYKNCKWIHSDNECITGFYN